MNNNVYLDHNATTTTKPAVARAVAESLERTGNPSSAHAPGRLARQAVEEARESVAALLGAEPGGVVFTSGGTEANNLALMGCARSAVISSVEHDSVLASAPEAPRIPVDGAGVADVAALEDLLASAPEPILVSVMLANNETGVIQPVAEIAERARRHGALTHCDAVQAAGKIPIDMASLGVDLLSVSAHKIGGPPGAGALVVGEGVDIGPRALGGGQERGLRGGTLNVPGITGLGVAARLAVDGLDDFAALAGLRQKLEDRIRALAPPVNFFGTGAERLPNTSCFALPGLMGDTQVIALDLAGVAVSAGSACSSGKIKASHVLKAMGAGDEEAACAIRVSLGWPSTESDVGRFVEAWGELAARGASQATEPAA